MCVVVERMKPEYADTVPASISATGWLSDSGKAPQLLLSKRRYWTRSGTLKAAFSLSSKILFNKYQLHKENTQSTPTQRFATTPI